MIYDNYVVYCHTNKINGKRYVGITSQKPERRWNNGNGYNGSSHFYNAIQKYGWEEFSHEILFTGLTKEEAKNKEIELIAKWDLRNNQKGYNQTDGGDFPAVKGKARSKLAVEKMVKTRKERNNYKNAWGWKVSMYSSTGEHIRDFPTAAQAQRDTGISACHILECCRNMRKTAGKHKWKYCEERDE